ncbi:hypothetical protein ATOP_16100 [Granulimonas faecalis]|uniref:histidine kinase n=1 Tax=Granulimonas faecalis TaxID=2894155 RepID=A0AAV5B2Z7_9ACTN|nr:HAMP domain-containing sensor histidine kinase [Granulimonas faecalis]GJM55955.1 hypothetical protein ATOP_16100 [Granulimonas faecalis]
MAEAGRDAVERLRHQLAVTIVGELLAVAAAFLIGLSILCATGAQSLSSPENGWWQIRELPASSPQAGSAARPWEDGLRHRLTDEGFAADPRPQLIRTGGELLIYRTSPAGGVRYVLVTGPCAALALVCGGTFIALTVTATGRFSRKVAAVGALEARRLRAESYFGDAAHELKAPLMAIGGWSAAARRGLVTTDDAYASIGREAGRMAALVDQIMGLARADAGRLKPHPHRADLRELLYDAERSLVPTATDKGVDLVLHGPQPVVCSFDLDLTYAAVLNMLTNAIRHGEGTVRLGCSAADGKARLWAVNDGAPISEEDLAVVFERFGKGKGGSTGIGMALALRYATAQGFSLSVRPVPRGTLALLEIPL